MSYKIALAGNPNSGKTTVFNLLCGAREKIGNWPGTTVEKKQGYFTYQDEKVEVVDLPGIYSMSAYSIDERIARDFLIKEKPDLVVCVIDASNLERNLYLVLQLLELGQPVLLDLNMMDMVEKSKMKIDVQKLSKILGVDVVQTVALKSEGIDDLKKKIIENLKGDRKVNFKIDYQDLESTLEEITSLLEHKGISLGIPNRAVSIRILEQDTDLLNYVKKSLPQVEEIKNKAEVEISKRTGEDLETFMIERRYAYLKGVVKECVKKELPLEDRLTFSDKLDKILTNRFLGIPLFLFFMYLLFQMVFTFATPFMDLIDGFFGYLANIVNVFFEQQGLPSWLGSFISDGVISGIGSVLIFLPNIMLLFLGISILESSGYLARAAFVMDRFMHALGLHGKSFIPMLLGFGCSIPAIMSTRTLESRKDRILTILIIPLMSCSARLPVYTLFAAALFPKNQGLVVFSLYVIGIVLAIFVAKVFKHLFFKGEVAPLVMELPPYRMPSLRNIFLSMWTRSSLFVKKAGTIIFMGVVLVWILSSLPLGVEYAGESSLIGRLGKMLAPLFKLAGFGFWQAAVSLVFGILAKEVVVGTLGTLYGTAEEGLKEVLLQQFTPLSAYAFLIMTLVYIPCIAAIGAIKRETNWRWTFLAVSYSLILGWVLSTLVYQIGKLFIGS